MPLSRISDDCKNPSIKNRAPEKSFKFPPKIDRDSRKIPGEKRQYYLHEWFDNLHTLKDSIESCIPNATYLSKTTQNNSLSCIKDFIQSEIVNDIQNQTEGSFFGISIDEVTDVSEWEQLGIVVRCVGHCQATEKLLQLIQCDNIKGASIAEFIINALNNAGLNPQMCRA